MQENKANYTTAKKYKLTDAQMKTLFFRTKKKDQHIQKCSFCYYIYLHTS